MKRLLIAAAAIALAASLCSALDAHAATASRSMIAAALESTVIVSGTMTSVDEDGELQAVNGPYCSGFVLSSAGTAEKIATARHCVDGDPMDGTRVTPQAVTFFDGDHALIRSIVRSNTADVAILTVRSMRHHPAFKLGGRISTGDPLFVLGMPAGVAWTLSTAQARNGSMVTDVGHGPDIYVECAGCFSGDSGGPIFDAGGGVIAVDSLIMPRQPAMHFAVPISEVVALLAK